MPPSVSRVVLLALAVALNLTSMPTHADTDCVVLLHGLARSSGSMRAIESALKTAGYDVVNVDYPSRAKPIEELAPLAFKSGVDGCPTETSNVHFVTHSLGGILVRYFLAKNDFPRLGRVVMLAPPNNGSEVVDKLRAVPGYKFLNGPAGLQLGTDEASVPRSLGPVDFPLGIIAGTRTFNPILSLGLTNPDDGKVSVASTKVGGMTDFLQVPHSHTFIMRAKIVIEQALFFIEHGAFRRDAGNS